MNQEDNPKGETAQAPQETSGGVAGTAKEALRPMKVCKALVSGIRNAWILVSGRLESESEYGKVETNVSFLYDAGRFAAEWEPKYGPIQIWERADNSEGNVRPHYFYLWVVNTPLNWSQLAVDDEGLKPAFAAGDYAHIFGVLKRWAEGREQS